MTYRDVLARNVRIARAAKRIGQQELAARMRALGFDAWLHQTVGNVERGKRRIVAEEILALALALETTIGRLMDPPPDEIAVELPSGDVILARSVIRSVRHWNDGMVSWRGNEPRIATREPETWPDTEMGAALRMAAISEVTSADMIERNERLHPRPPGGWPEPRPLPRRGEDA